MNKERFADLIQFAERIPLKEYNQNHFGRVLENDEGGACGTEGCIAYHFAKNRPEYGLAVHLLQGGDFSIVHQSNGYIPKSQSGYCSSVVSMAQALEINADEAGALFNGTLGYQGRSARAKVLARLQKFWREQTGKSWRSPRAASARKAA